MKATRKEILSALGLEVRRRPTDYLIPAAGILGAGLVIGIGMGMILAPKSGRHLREDIGSRFNSSRHALREKGESFRQRVRGRRGVSTEELGVGSTQTRTPPPPTSGQDILHS